MSTWSYPLEFDIGVTASCSNTAAASIKIQMMAQDISDVLAGTADALTAPDWSNPVSVTPPFTFGDITLSGMPEAGAIGTDEMTLEADNLVVGQLNAADIRMYDVILGHDAGTGLEFDADETMIHVRVLYKAAGAANYSVRYWGIIDFSTVEVIMGDVSDPDTYQVKCRVIDSMYALERFSMIQFVEAQLQMTGAYTSTAKYITFLGDLPWDGVTITQGRHVLLNIKWDDGGRVEWLGNRQNPPVSDSNDATQNILYFSIVQILQAAHDFLGLESSTVNDGAAWFTRHNWRFFYNDAVPGSTSLTEMRIDELYIVAGYEVWDGTQNVYAHRGTFFDRDKSAPHSLMQAASPLDALKRICTSLGMVFRVAVNSAGERYLDVRAADLGGTAIGWDADNRWYSDVKIKPFARRLTGVEVVSGEENINRGVIGNESVKVECIFTVANFIRTEYDFRRYARSMPGGEIGVVIGATPAHAFWSALWAFGGSPTGNNYPGAYTICAIAPGMVGNALANRFGGTSVYIQRETEGTAEFDLGDYLTSSGIPDWTASGVSGTVLYPNDAAPVNTWGEVPAMALSHYLFSPHSETRDRVGIYRAKGIEIEITRGEIIGTAPPAPGTLVTVNLPTHPAPIVCRIVRTTENLVENTTTFTLEYWGI